MAVIASHQVEAEFAAALGFLAAFQALPVMHIILDEPLAFPLASVSSCSSLPVVEAVISPGQTGSLPNSRQKVALNS